MRGPQALAVVVLLVVVALIGVWLALSRTSESPEGAVAPKVEEQERPAAKPAALATKPEETSRAQASQIAPVPHASTSNATLRVLVRDAEDANVSVDGAEVEVVDAFGDAQKTSSTSKTEFTCPALPPGEYRVRAIAVDHLTTRTRAELKPGESSKDVIVALVRAPRIRVRWLSRDGTPLADAITRSQREGAQLGLAVFATQMPPSDTAMPAWNNVGALQCTATAGQPLSNASLQRNPFEKKSVQARPSAGAPAEGEIGVLIPDASLPLFVSAWSGQMLVDTQRVDPGAKEVVFTSALEDLIGSRATLKLRVVDSETSAPIVGASVELKGGSEMTLPVSDDGHIAVAGIVPGAWHLEVSAKGHGSHVEELFLRPKEMKDLGDVHLGAPSKFVLHVVDEQGQPLRDVGLHFTPIDDSSLPLEHENESDVTSGPSGTIQAEGPRGRFAVGVLDDRFALQPSVIDTRTGPVDARLVLRAGIRIAVDFDPLPDPGALARVSASDGVPVRTKLVPASGTLSFALVPGEYKLALIENGVTSAGVPFTVDKASFVLQIGR